MKKVIVTVFCLSIASFATHAQEKKAPEVKAAQTEEVDPKAAKFQFKDQDNTHNFGEVPEGPSAEYDFEFKNVGKKPIVITEAHGSCGCTVPTWPKEPILPKKKGTIHVTYNTNGRVGPITKDVTITYNDGKTAKLFIRGTVKAKPAESKPTPPPPPAPNH